MLRCFTFMNGKVWLPKVTLPPKKTTREAKSFFSISIKIEQILKTAYTLKVVLVKKTKHKDRMSYESYESYEQKRCKATK